MPPSLFDLPLGPDDAEVPAARDAKSRRTDLPAAPLTVTELTADIRAVLESGFAQVLVEGELSNCRLWRTGHLYFTLKDAGAQIRGVMFRSDVRRLRFAPEDGQHVVARGRLGVYDQKGEYQIVCETFEPAGHGARQLAFDQLKRKLAAEGLFDPGRKRPLPLLPRKIGVVTSLDGAALRDILTVLGSRYPQAHVVVRPARVQGEGAAQEIARGLHLVGRVEGVEVVIVGRGGGSIEDLWAFNEEAVARAIAACPVPVISAVGHETDVTIADFVADLRAPTPSAAAEQVVARRDEFVARIDRQRERLAAAVARRLLARRTRLHALESSRGLARVPQALALTGRHVGELADALGGTLAGQLRDRARRLGLVGRALERHDPERRLAAARTRLAAGRARLRAAVDRRRARGVAQLASAAGRLDSLSPLSVLGRGYAVCWDATRTRVIRAATEVVPGEAVRVTLGQGELECEVKPSNP